MQVTKKDYYNSFPLLIILCIMPLIVKGHIYTYSDSSFGTFAAGNTYTDFYSYCKDIIFYIISGYMLYRILWELLQGRLKRPCKSFCLLSGFLICSFIISSVFAINPGMAIWGGYQRFEGTLVKICYVITAMYTWMVMSENNCQKIIIRGLFISVSIECIIGFLQMVGKDPIFWKPIQTLILPAGYKNSDLVNRLSDTRVYLTLANPNYASIYLATMIIIMSFFILHNRRSYYLVLLDAICFIEMIATRSRVGLLMLLAALTVFLILERKSVFQDKKRVLITCAMVAVLFLIAEFVTDFAMIHRIIDTRDSFSSDGRHCSITDLKTNKNNIEFENNKITVCLYCDGPFDNKNIVAKTKNGKDITSCIVYENGGKINYKGLRDTRVSVEKVNGEALLALSIDDVVFHFIYDKEAGGYQIIDNNGYYESISDIRKVNFHGLEHLASGRLYIWSRTIPLITALRSIAGYGADNFYLAFPQSDYLGKAWYCKTPYTIVEKPHNTFLLFAVENGIFSLIIFIMLITVSISKCIQSMHKDDSFQKNTAALTILLLVSYIIAYFFNDSSIVISPLFWVLIGLSFTTSSSR